MAAAAITLLMTMVMPMTSCTKETDTTAIVINLDSIVIKPYLNFGTPLADAEKYMAENYADYVAENPNSLEYVELDGGVVFGHVFFRVSQRCTEI